MSQWNKETIKLLRKKLGLSQSDFALALGCRQQTISEWELGLYEPANAYNKLLDMISLQSQNNLAASQTSWSSPMTKEKAKKAVVKKAQSVLTKSKSQDKYEPQETSSQSNYYEPEFREFDPAID
ncbi:MAG: helix-turn-helix transcriptional regulator [Oligoflexia bacterium]|nr:helix-turn-helix transcriptional regulator [Oligoflexia bacterium]